MKVRAGRAGSRHREVEVAATSLRASNNGEVADAASHRSTDSSFLLDRPGQLANIELSCAGRQAQWREKRKVPRRFFLNRN